MITNHLQQSSLPEITGKTCIVITGPTAVGKTTFAIQLAQQLGTQIISADSRQCFKELNIGVARPSEEELKEVKHHLIATKSIHEYFSAGEYEREVLALLDELYKKNDLVILCGGTGFYINAVLSGFDEIPIVDDNIRTSLNQQFQENGILSLQEQLKILDIKLIQAREGSKEFEAELHKIFTNWQNGFDLEHGPTYSIGYVYGYKDGSARIYFALHHLIIDTVSWRILVEDLKDIYNGKDLAPKNSSYRQLR